MKRWLALLLVVVSQVPVVAEDRIFTPEKLRAAVRDASARAQAGDPRLNWNNVRRIPKSSRIVLYTGTGGRKCQFVSADDTGLTVIDLETPTRPTLRIERSAVTGVSRYFGRSGSVGGAIAGAAGGFFLGLYTATLLAYKDCHGNCGDEQALIGISLVGFPVLGGVLGYSLGGGNRGLEKIYIAP